MKKLNHEEKDRRILSIQTLIFLSLLGLLSFVLGSCADNCEVTNSYSYYEPVYTTMNDLRSAVEVVEPVELKQPGKIYFSNNYLFINEPNEGVHIINNADPSNPVNEAFIEIPGAFDLAVRGNYLYSDSYIDLVVIDISNLDNIQEVGRVENVFENYNSYGYYASEEGIVTDWEFKEVVNVTESECESTQYEWGIYYNRGIATSSFASFDASAAVSPTNPGMGGSMARFAVAKDHLYSLDVSNLIPFSLANATEPLAGESQHLGWDIETIFPKEDKLFIGTRNGMHILDIADNPLSPNFLSTYSHITSCDPVVVEGDYAYVTLRSGTACEGFTNQLEVIDITDLESPELLHVYAMDNPHGLGIDDNVLFICDGASGLKIYDATDVSTIDDNQLAHYEGIQAFDIIPFNNIAMMIGEDGLFQYDYSDLNNITLLSTIDFNPEQ